MPGPSNKWTPEEGDKRCVGIKKDDGRLIATHSNINRELSLSEPVIEIVEVADDVGPPLDSGQVSADEVESLKTPDRQMRIEIIEVVSKSFPSQFEAKIIADDCDQDIDSTGDKIDQRQDEYDPIRGRRKKAMKNMNNSHN